MQSRRCMMLAQYCRISGDLGNMQAIPTIAMSTSPRYCIEEEATGEEATDEDAIAFESMIYAPWASLATGAMLAMSFPAVSAAAALNCSQPVVI